MIRFKWKLIKYLARLKIINRIEGYFGDNNDLIKLSICLKILGFKFWI